MTQPPLLAVMQGGECRSPATHFQIYTEVLQHPLRGGKFALKYLSTSTLQRAHIIHDIPHVGGTHAGLAIQSLHRAVNSNTLPNVDEDLAIRSTVIPLVIGQIR